MVGIGACETDHKPVLMDVKETANYLNIGETKTRELLRGRNGFGIQIGNRWYANKDKLDLWISRNTR